MNDKTLFKMIVLDEIIKHRLSKSKFVLSESQDQTVDRIVEGFMDKVKAFMGGDEASPKSTGTGKPEGMAAEEIPMADAAEDAIADNPEAQQGVKKGLGAWGTLKKKGVLGGYFHLLQKLMKGYMTVLFGTGMFDSEGDALAKANQLAKTAETDPSKVPDIIATDLEKVKTDDPKIDKEKEALIDASEEAEEDIKEDPPNPEEGAEEGAGSGPVPLFKGPGGGLYSKLFSSLTDRLTAMTKDKDSMITNAKINKEMVKDTVKQILKDLSAQLRVNGLKVTESWERSIISLAEVQAVTFLLSEAAKNPKPVTGKDLGDNYDEFQPGGNATQIPTKTGAGRVKPTKGQVEAGRAVGGKVQDLIMRLGGGDRADMYDDPELRTMVQKNSQKLVTTIITKVVKPYLEPYLKKAGVKLKESHEKAIVQELTKIIMEGITKKINV